MPPEILRNPTDEIYGYTCKKKTQTYDMLRSFVVAEFCLDASVRPSLKELSSGQSTASEYSSTEVWVRRLNLRRLRENLTGRRICCNSGEPRPASKPHTPIKFTSTLDLVEQLSEVKAVEFWQPANDNMGAVSRA